VRAWARGGGGRTCQSTSGADKEAMDELFEQTRGVYVNESFHKFRNKFTKQIAFNVIPRIDDFMGDGATREKWKTVAETRNNLDPDLQVTATCARVPVFIGHAEAVSTASTSGWWPTTCARGRR